MFLPFSHEFTPGFNNWTNGLYGYSWDMMVHSWNTQHVSVRYVDSITGREGYLQHDFWSHGSDRWSSNAHSLKQYAVCVAERLHQYNITSVQLYFDVWCSLNARFQQRMFDPRVDLVTADWSAFEPVTWQMPLLSELSDWRSRLQELQQQLYNSANDTDVVFIADFPGLTFEMYIQEELADTELQLLSGSVEVMMDSGSVHRLKPNDTIQVLAGEFISVRTLPSRPSCYMYTFTNVTSRQLRHNITLLDRALDRHRNADNATEAALKEAGDAALARVWTDELVRRQRASERADESLSQTLRRFFAAKIKHFRRAYAMSKVAAWSLLTGQSFGDVLKASVVTSQPNYN